MKSKKGFTLIELLAVIAILGIVIAIAIPTYLNVRKQSLEKQYDNVVSRIETAAEKYAKETSLITVSVEQLIKEGYLPADDETDIYDPRDNESLNCRMLEVKVENDTYTAKLTDMDLKESNGKCSPYEVKSIMGLITAECYSENNNQEEINRCNNALKNTNGKWYTGSVKLSINNKSGKKITGYNWTSLTGDNGKDETLIVTAEKGKNTTYSVVITYEDNTSEKGSIDINIDNEKPNIANIGMDQKWTNTNKDVKVEASDGIYSGIDSYYIGTNPNCPIDGFADTNVKNLGTGTYYVCAKDKAGNISDVRPIVVDKIDKTNPYCTGGKLSSTSITEDAVCQDNESGIKDIEYYVSTDPSTPPQDSNGWKSKTDISFSVSCGTTYYLFVKATDMAGNIFVSKESVNSYSGGSCYSGGGSSLPCSPYPSCQFAANGASCANNPSSCADKHNDSQNLADKYGDRYTYDSASGEWTDNNTGKCVNCITKKP